MLGGNNETEIANPARFARRLKLIPVRSTMPELAKIYALPVMQQLHEMQALGSKELEALDAIEAACNEEIAFLLRHYEPSTVSSLLTRYKKVLAADGLGEHPFALYFHMPRELQTEIKIGYQSRVTEDNRNLRAFRNHKKYIETARGLLSSTGSYMRLAIGLCALTGRRPGEILVTAQFDPVDAETVTFRGQLKTKNADGARDNYRIPVLADSAEIIEALARLRESRDFTGIPVPPGKTLGQAVNLRTAKQQNDVTRATFAEFFDGDITAYSLRPAYALIAAHRYKPQTVTQRAYFAEILGHGENDTSTAAAYEDFYLSTEE